VTTLDPSLLSETVRPPVDRFMDRIDSALLRAGIPRVARRSVMGAVESDLMGRIQQRSTSALPDEAAVTAALEELGAGTPPPEAIAADPLAWRAYLAVTMPRRSRCAWWGAALTVLSLLPLVAILVAVMFFSPDGVRVTADFPREQFQTEVGAEGPEATLFRAEGRDGSIVATSRAATPLARFYWLFLPITPLALAATLLGIIAIVDIRRSRGKRTGMGPAVFAALFYPLLLTVITAWLR
jgi:hypothetical protein